MNDEKYTEIPNELLKKLEKWQEKNIK